jgi:uncharacterized protein
MTEENDEASEGILTSRLCVHPVHSRAMSGGRLVSGHGAGGRMEESIKSGPEQVFDASPYLRLFIDKEGRWFQNGAEIIHVLIYQQFNQMLEKSQDGFYQVRLGREICRVEVEDAPFVVRRVLDNPDGGLSVELNDGTVEPFAPEHFWIGDSNVPYTMVKNQEFHARFSRPAYYQLARFISSDEAGTEFFLNIDGQRWPVEKRNR